MKFTLISDIHTDSNQWDWNILDGCDPTVPMVVAGDIANDVWQTCHWITELRNRFPTVVFVAGNHDFYNSGFHKTRVVPSREWAEKWPSPSNVTELYDHYTRWFKAHDVHFLHRGAVEIDGVQFVGGTGWHDFQSGAPLSYDTQVNAWKNYISDSRYINWNTDKPYQSVLEASVLDADAIAQNVASNTLPKVIVTHHIPHRNCVLFKPDPIWNALNGSFCNTKLENIKDPSIKAWCFGHTHYQWDKQIGDTRYLCNPRGYPGENPNWTPIEVEI